MNAKKFASSVKLEDYDYMMSCRDHVGWSHYPAAPPGWSCFPVSSVCDAEDEAAGAKIKPEEQPWESAAAGGKSAPLSLSLQITALTSWRWTWRWMPPPERWRLSLPTCPIRWSPTACTQSWWRRQVRINTHANTSSEVWENTEPWVINVWRQVTWYFI